MSNMQPFMPEPDGGTAAASSPSGSPRNVVLACIGLLSLMSDEITAWLERSVPEAGRRHAAPRAHDEWPTGLPRPALPTHRDFAALLQRVTELEQQIDQIAGQRAARQ